MSIQPIGAVSGFAPVLVIDRARFLGVDVVRLADPSEIIGESAVINATSPSSPSDNRVIEPFDRVRERTFVQSVNRQLTTESNLFREIDASAIPLPYAELKTRYRYDKLFLFGGMMLDVIV